MVFQVRGTPNPGVNSFKKTMFFIEEVIDYSDVCYSNAMPYTIQWQEMSSKQGGLCELSFPSFHVLCEL